MLHLIVKLALPLFPCGLLYVTALPSDFYKPGHGVFFQCWLTKNDKYSFSRFDDIPQYPSCSTFVVNGDNFEYSTLHLGQNQHCRFRAYFVSSQTGIHKFFSIVNNAAELYIDLSPTGSKEILAIQSRTNNNWDERKWSQEVNLIKGFRYKLTFLYYGNGHNPEFLRLGVRFPDGSEEKPISSKYLWRSMEFYKWSGVIAHKYDNFQYPESRSDYTLANLYSMNPSYPSNPSSFQCKSTLYDSPGHRFEYYALRYIGYMAVPANASYKFRMHCNEICEFFVTKNDVETSLGHYSLAKSLPDWIEMDGGALSSNVWYPIKAFLTESYSNDYLQIEHSEDSVTYSNSWNGMLTNLLPETTAVSIPEPVPTMINSTAILILLPSSLYLPPNDNWTHALNSEVLYHRKDVDEPVQSLVASGALPTTVIVNGLRKYTDYVFYAQFYGQINGEDHNIITGYSVTMKTDEDVPDVAPPGVNVAAKSSTSIRVKWNTLPQLTYWNGVALGYEVQYRQKNAITSNWTSALTTGFWLRQYFANDLRKYTVYEFKVAARTSKGSGPFSPVIEERTMEDVPSAGPANITAQNTSSSSVSVHWNDVPFEHQNGIITGYKVYIRKSGHDGEWDTVEVTTKHCSFTGLDLWTLYDVNVSAITSVGEGVQSDAVKVKTDEDVPGAAPVNVMVLPLSSRSLNVTWENIPEDKQYGIVSSYSVKYQRTDGRGQQKEVIVFEKQAKLDGLAEDRFYDIYVAGMTSKGIGVYSSKAINKTTEDAPDASPGNLKGNYTNSTGIELKWNTVPEENRNGIITKYILQYRAKESLSAWKEVAIDAGFLTVQIANLDYFTVYECRIAAETVVGRGPFSNITHIRTDADAPTKAPVNLTGHFLDQHTIEMKWGRVPKEHRHGVILGYKLHYMDATISDGPWYNITTPNKHDDSDVLNQTVTGLKIFTPYLFRILAFTYKSEGILSDNVTVWTDEDVPEVAPRNVSGLNASSTEIILRWAAMEEIHRRANGKVLGYTVKYSVLDCHEDRPIGCDENQMFNITSNGSAAEIIIPGLRKFTSYSLSVQVFNSKGRGNFSTAVNITTDEDKPGIPPTYFETWPSKINSIMLYWSPIPESLRNGIILGYRIFYMAIDEPQRRYDRAPRSVNEFTAYGALNGETMIECNSSTYEIEITDLRNYSWYNIRIGAYTSKGLGPTFTVKGTTRQESPVEAPKLEVIDKYDFEEILLKWQPVSQSGANGEILGYTVQYWLAELLDEPIIKAKKYSVDIKEPTRTTIIKGLQPYATYRIRIQAFTEGGLGVWSKRYNGETCRCSKELSSARMPFLPLVSSDNLEVLPLLIDDAISNCCGNCTGKHGTTHINWEKDSTGASSIKYNRKEMLDALVVGTNIALPIFLDSFDMRGDVSVSEYVIVPLVEVHHFAVFTRKFSPKELANAASSIVSFSIFEQYPFLLVSLLLTTLAGILFWVFERDKNKMEFSDNYAKGCCSGIWLAFITMTTVGYGDLTPVTKKGRLHAMLWMLIGLVLTSIVIGNISSTLSSEFVSSPSMGTQKKNILAAAENFMIATQLYGNKITIGNTSDGKYVQQSLLSGNVSEVIMDVYTAGILKDYLSHPDIIMNDIKSMKASYGVALAGETRRMKHCVNRFFQMYSKNGLEKISEQTFLHQMASADEVDTSKHTMSSSSDIMSGLTSFGGVTLAVFIVLGAMYELRRFVRGRAKIETYTDIVCKFVEEIQEDIFELERRISSTVGTLDQQHEKERLKLSQMHYARISALLSMYPSLHVFDPSIPKPKNSKTKANEVPVYHDVRENDYDDDDDGDMPIYYRMDGL